MTGSPQIPPENTCNYCGAPLSPNVYFCLKCAKPYKENERVLPPVPEEYLTLEKKIDAAAPQAKTITWIYLYALIFMNIGAGFLLNRVSVRTIMLTMEMVLLTITIILGFKYRESLKRQFLTFGFTNKYALYGLLLLPVVVAINFGYHHAILYFASGSADGGRQSVMFSQFSKVELLIMVAVMPAIIEEVAFRGLLQHWLTKAVSPRVAILVASALFAMMHLAPVSFPIHLLIGILFGWTKYKTGSLYPAMLLHFLHNFIVIVYF